MQTLVITTVVVLSEEELLEKTRDFAVIAFNRRYICPEDIVGTRNDRNRAERIFFF